MRDRASYALGIVSVAGIVDTADGRITSAVLALGGVGTMPWRDHAAQAALAGDAPIMKENGANVGWIGRHMP